MTVVDASVWVSSLVAQDIHHDASREWLGNRLAEGATLVVPTLLLPEVAGAVVRRVGSPELGIQAREGILRFPKLRLVSLDPDLAGESARVASELRLRGADAVYVAVSLRLNLPLVTWDQELEARAAGFVQVTTP